MIYGTGARGHESDPGAACNALSQFCIWDLYILRPH